MNYCPECGTHTINFKYPYKCISCPKMFWKNPKPAVLVLQPIIMNDGKIGIVTVRRTIPPGIGELCLPCGYVDSGEQWADAAARELLEEANIKIDPKDLYISEVQTLEEDVMVIFAFSKSTY